MSKKAYDLAKVQNELKGASSFFKKPAAAPEQAVSSPTPPAIPASEPTNGRPSGTTSRRHGVMPSPAGLDINQETASHDTLRLAINETKALEALKSALKWEQDLTVSKNDICRVALHALLEDYQTKGAASDAVKRLRTKHGRY
jgi:hypothetical protein